MNRMLIAGVALAAVIAGAGYYAIQAGGKAAESTSSSAAAGTFTSNADRAMYGFGLQVGNQIRGNMENVRAMGATLNNDALAAGFRDGLADKPGLTSEEINAAETAFRGELEALAKAEHEKKKTESDAFLTAKAGEAGWTKTESGLLYKVVTEGDGKTKPTKADTVVVHYTGTLVDGKKFDSSVDRGQPAEFGVGQVIPGWTEALQLMSKGAKYQLVIPSNLAYGEAGAGQTIPPNAVLLFDVELLDIKTAGK
ncbi:FKBP-type peptidyl-prolyl cis-trans isomerase [Permianibacter sp. IMCC34836]|nr:FKBP-type peptidyl-prolyl cis-trans isomerase [Permianibacter fluminis]